jgi:hypothetical protein
LSFRRKEKSVISTQGEICHFDARRNLSFRRSEKSVISTRGEICHFDARRNLSFRREEKSVISTQGEICHFDARRNLSFRRKEKSVISIIISVPTLSQSPYSINPCTRFFSKPEYRDLPEGRDFER